MSTPFIDEWVERYKRALEKARERGRLIEPLEVRAGLIPTGRWIQELAHRYKAALRARVRWAVA